ncbi:DUF4198 domain-containing protein [Pedobacter mucosus]|uniref:DUF4198 domain-containing protein n=1 Tax=Pedobacter mucosus TaxID=2895286 RepID=UPI001EE403D9|nr:DUF4198 domain-containing protein [Pedobacter mucosus]UKT63902.1 DUF4198 domain-containing protein [Pedobacter mucosus]
MKSRLFLITLLLSIFTSSVFSHAMWIETLAKGKKGQAQEVKIFFGEYESGKPDSAATWFSNLKEFKLVLTAPNGTTKILSASPDVFFYKANFTPDQDGAYKLSIVHEVAAVYDKAKIEYYAFADVSVGKYKTNTNYPVAAVLTIRPEKHTLATGETSAFQLIYNKAPFAKQKLAIVNPENKKIEPETDADGKFNFKPILKGTYFLEAFTEDKNPGKLDGKDYEKTWHLVTYTTQVN